MLVVQSCPTLCNPMDYTVPGILQVGIREWEAIPFSRGIFPTQGSNPGFPPCRQILYCLSHQGSPGPYIFYSNFFQFFLSFCHFWLGWVFPAAPGLFAAAHGLALIAASGGSSLVAVLSLSLWWLSLSQSTGSGAPGLRDVVHEHSCSWACGIFVPAPQIEPVRVPCLRRQILNHWAAREVPQFFLIGRKVIFLLKVYGAPPSTMGMALKDAWNVTGEH